MIGRTLLVMAFLASLGGLAQAQETPAKPADPAAPATSASTVTNKGPVDIEADQMEVLQKEKQAIFTGKVVAKREDVTLKTDRLVVVYADVKQPDGSMKPDVTNLDAKGNVVIITKRETITGDWAKLDPATDILEVGGKVSLTQGTTVLQGSHLTANLKTNKMDMTGGRVKGSFVPE